jgi:succinoglycan biosynthesis transport protein ExoP
LTRNFIGPAKDLGPQQGVLRAVDSSLSYQSDRSAEAAVPAEQSVIDLVVLLRILRVRRHVIAGTAVIVLALISVVLWQLTPLYSASSVVMLDKQKNSVEDVASVLSGISTDPVGVQNQVQILTSRDLAERVVDKLNLEQDPQFSNVRAGRGYARLLNPVNWFSAHSEIAPDPYTEANQRRAVIDQFQQHLTVAPVGLSSALTVTYASPDARDAARIANAVADAYVEDQLNVKFDATQKATAWLADRIKDLSRQAQAADAAVQEYRAQNGLTETTNGGSVVDQQMSDISGQLVLAKSDLAEKQATYSHVSALAVQGHAADISQAVASPVITQLRAQEADLIRQEADLSSKYGPRNPKMVQLESQKTNLEGKIDEEVQRTVRSVANDVSIAQAHVNSLQASLNHIESQSGVQNQLKVKLTALQSSASSAKAMYEAFLSKLNQTQDQQGIQTPDARIISRATVPSAPSYPKKSLVIAAAIPAGLLLGFLLACMMERLDSGFRTAQQVESALGLPVLATIPEVRAIDLKNGNAASRVVDKPMSSFSEAVRGLQLAVAVSNPNKRPKVIAVTSSVPGEGKTTVAVSMARLASKSGLKVLLLEGDLRRRRVASAVGLVRPETGLLEALSGSRSLENCWHKDPHSDVLVLPCVKRPISAPDVLASKGMRHLIEHVSTVFDLIIVDTAPVLPVSDTKILSRLMDTMILVTRWEKTPREGVANALRALNDVHAPVAGIALARADMSRFQYYSFGLQNYRSYNKYYSD